MKHSNSRFKLSQKGDSSTQHQGKSVKAKALETTEIHTSEVHQVYQM